jgi:hypothetical protein
MAEKKQPEMFDVKDAPWQRAPNHQNIYVNNAGIALSSYDIQLRMAQITTIEGKPIIQEVATIFMAPGQAKATALLLLRAVSDYEKTHKITFPVPEHLGKVIADIGEDAKGAKK